MPGVFVMVILKSVWGFFACQVLGLPKVSLLPRLGVCVSSLWLVMLRV